jgi:hypothetical protein
LDDKKIDLSSIYLYKFIFNFVYKLFYDGNFFYIKNYQMDEFSVETPVIGRPLINLGQGQFRDGVVFKKEDFPEYIQNPNGITYDLRLVFSTNYMGLHLKEFLNKNVHHDYENISTLTSTIGSFRLLCDFKCIAGEKFLRFPLLSGTSQRSAFHVLLADEISYLNLKHPELEYFEDTPNFKLYDVYRIKLMPSMLYDLNLNYVDSNNSNSDGYMIHIKDAFIKKCKSVHDVFDRMTFEDLSMMEKLSEYYDVNDVYCFFNITKRNNEDSPSHHIHNGRMIGVDWCFKSHPYQTHISRSLNYNGLIFEMMIDSLHVIVAKRINCLIYVEISDTNELKIYIIKPIRKFNTERAFDCRFLFY